MDALILDVNHMAMKGRQNIKNRETKSVVALKDSKSAVKSATHTTSTKHFKPNISSKTGIKIGATAAKNGRSHVTMNLFSFSSVPSKL